MSAARHEQRQTGSEFAMEVMTIMSRKRIPHAFLHLGRQAPHHEVDAHTPALGCNSVLHLWSMRLANPRDDLRKGSGAPCT